MKHSITLLFSYSLAVTEVIRSNREKVNEKEDLTKEKEDLVKSKKFLADIICDSLYTVRYEITTLYLSVRIIS